MAGFEIVAPEASGEAVFSGFTLKWLSAFKTDKMVKRGGLSIHLQKAPKLSKEWGEGQISGFSRGIWSSMQERTIRALKKSIQLMETKNTRGRDIERTSYQTGQHGWEMTSYGIVTTLPKRKLMQLKKTNRKGRAVRKQKYSWILSVFLIALLAHPQERPADKCSSLIQAAGNGQVDKVSQLINQGIEVDCRGPQQYTALIAAAKANRIEVVRILCSKHADANARTEFRYPEEGYSALLWAIENENMAIAELLLINGANSNLADGWGETPLKHAVWKNNLPLVELLLRSGADVLYRKEVDGRSVLFDAMYKRNISIIDSIIAHGADPKIRDSEGWNLIMIASQASFIEGAKFGVAAGIGINDRTKSGITAIDLAVLHDSEENLAILEYLIKMGGNISAKDEVGKTPLMEAAQAGAAKAMKMLIKEGANANECDTFGSTSLHYAAKGAGPTENEEAIIALICGGAKIEARDNAGSTPLIVASKSRKVRLLRALIRNGANVNAQENGGWTALMFAAKDNQIEILRLLLDEKADLGLKTKTGQTAFSIAKETPRSREAYELLKSRGPK